MRGASLDVDRYILYAREGCVCWLKTQTNVPCLSHLESSRFLSNRVKVDLLEMSVGLKPRGMGQLPFGSGKTWSSYTCQTL